MPYKSYNRRPRRVRAYRRREMKQRTMSAPNNRQLRRIAAGASNQSSYKWDMAQLAKNVLKYGSIAATTYAKLNSELKWFDTTVVSGSVSNVWITPVPLCQVPQGDGASTRDGNSIRVKSLFIKGAMVNNSAATDGSLVRVVVWKQDDDVAPTATNYAAAGISTFRNMAETKNYIGLYDKVFKLSTNGGPNEKFQFKINLSLDLPLRYPDNTTSYPQSNNLFCMMISDESTNPPSVFAGARIRYYDN